MKPDTIDRKISLDLATFPLATEQKARVRKLAWTAMEKICQRSIQASQTRLIFKVLLRFGATKYRKASSQCGLGSRLDKVIQPAAQHEEKCNGPQMISDLDRASFNSVRWRLCFWHDVPNDRVGADVANDSFGAGRRGFWRPAAFYRAYGEANCTANTHH